VPWWVWISVGALALVLFAGAVFAAVVFQRVKRLRTTLDAIAAHAEEIARRGEKLDSRLAHVTERAEEAQQHLDRLHASFERLSVLTWALGDARESVARLRGAYLRK
jgi:DNA anti-recombination protein RmuC